MATRIQFPKRITESWQWIEVFCLESLQDMQIRIWVNFRIWKTRAKVLDDA